MASEPEYARCNFDGRPIHPEDATMMARFGEWLALPEDERRAPEWHEFLGIDTPKTGVPGE